MKTGKWLAINVVLGAAVCLVAVAAVPAGASPGQDQAQVKRMDSSGMTSVQLSRNDPGGDQISVELTGEAISVNGQATTLAEFSKAMTDAAGSQGKNAKVKFHCAPEVTMDQVYAVQDQMMNLGMKRVVFAGGKDSGVPLVLPTKAAKSRLDALPPAQVLNLELLPDRKMVVDGHTMLLGKARTVISGKLGDTPDAVVSLTPFARCTYKEMMEVLEHLKTAGAHRIALQELK